MVDMGDNAKIAYMCRVHRQMWSVHPPQDCPGGWAEGKAEWQVGEYHFSGRRPIPASEMIVREDVIGYAAESTLRSNR